MHGERLCCDIEGIVTPTQELLQHLWLIVEARTSGVTSHLIAWPPPDSKIRVLQLCFRYLLVCPSWQKVQDGVTVWWYDINLINTAIPAEEKHLPLYYELASKSNVEYIAGGNVSYNMYMLYCCP